MLSPGLQADKVQGRVRRREPRAKSIGDINEQAARLSNTARGTRLARISRIAQAYRNNINDRLQSVDWQRRANIRVSYGARIGDRYAPLAAKGSNGG